jgi:transketolase
MLAHAGSGHTGGSLSCVEILTVLYFQVMRHNPKDPNWSCRDRFILSKGHACPALYAVLALCGYFKEEDLYTLRRLNSPLQGHPDMLTTKGVEISTGSLGQGLSVGVGMALAGKKLDKKDYYVYVLLGDGEVQEGQVWEAAMSAAHYKLDNIIAFIDYNKYQIDGKLEDVMEIEPLFDKWQAFGWYTQTVDGHDISSLIEAIERAKKIKEKPKMIIAQTIKGKGVSFIENDPQKYHGIAPTRHEAELALKELKEEVLF